MTEKFYASDIEALIGFQRNIELLMAALPGALGPQKRLVFDEQMGALGRAIDRAQRYERIAGLFGAYLDAKKHQSIDPLLKRIALILKGEPLRPTSEAEEEVP